MASRASLFAVFLVVGLLVGFGVGYAIYQGQVSSLQSDLNQANESNSMLKAELQNQTVSLALSLQSGQMIHSGWVLVSPIGSGDYAVSLHAEGLEGASSGAYIVEGVTRQGMNMVPLAGTVGASEFVAGVNGSGNFWTTLMQNPSTAYEGIDLIYLPGMNMTHATLVASAQLG
jgi:hypothetical protein